MTPRILIDMICKNSGLYIRRCIDEIIKLDYPKEKISFAILENDSEDGTYLELKNKIIPRLMNYPYRAINFNKIDFGYKLRPESRHLPRVQKKRLRCIALAHQYNVVNYLKDNDYIVVVDTHLTKMPVYAFKKLLSYNKELISPTWKLANGKWYDAGSEYKGQKICKLALENPAVDLWEITSSNCRFLISRKVIDAGILPELSEDPELGYYNPSKILKAGFKSYLTTSVELIHASVCGTKSF